MLLIPYAVTAPPPAPVKSAGRGCKDRFRFLHFATYFFLVNLKISQCFNCTQFNVLYLPVATHFVIYFAGKALKSQIA